MRKCIAIAFILAATLIWPIARAQAAGDITYKIEALAGTGFCLDIVNDAAKNKVTAAKCGKYTGQFWTYEPIGNLREAYVRLRTQFTGEAKCLDVVNDATKDKLVMAPCGNFTGQMWAITLVGPDGLAQLRSKFTGATACLQLNENDKPSRVRMADCSAAEEQQWRVSLQ